MAQLEVRAARLSAYLAWAARQPQVWGDFDCTVGLAARWVETERGVDPAKPFRGLYTSPLGAARLIKRLGGLHAAVAHAAAEAGLPEVDRFQLGDVGLVAAFGPTGRPRQALAIGLSQRWAMLSPRGLIFAPAQALTAWRV